MIDPEVQMLLDQKQGEIMGGMPVSIDGQLGDFRTNIAHKGQFFNMMKVGELDWLFSSPYTRNPAIGDILYEHVAQRTYAHRDIYNGTFRETFNAVVTSG